MMTPRYGSYHESTSIAFNGASISPCGGGSSFTMLSKTSSMPTPVLAEVSTAFDVSMPITSSICALTCSGCAAGRSILLMTVTNS